MTAVTYTNSVTSPNDIVGEALESPPPNAGPGDDLTLNSGVFLLSTGGDVTLSAGDDVFIHGNVGAATAGKTISITAGAGDNDGLGSLTIDGELRASNVRLAALHEINLSRFITADQLLDLAAGKGISQTGGAIDAARLQSTAGVTGDVTFTGGTNHIAALGDFAVTSGDFALVDDVATLTIDGDVSAEDISIVNTRAGGRIVHASTRDISGRNIELIADDMALDAGTITATDTISLAPATSGTAVSLGFVASGLSFIQDALDSLSAPALSIGKDTSGTVTAGSIRLGSASLASNTLNLFAQGEIRWVSDFLTVGGGSGTINFNAGGTVIASVRAGTIGGSADGGFVLSNASTTAWTVNAMSTSGGEILVLSGGISVAGALTSHGGNMKLLARTIALNADVDAGSGLIGLVSTSGISQGAGKLTGAGLIAYADVAGSEIALTNAANAVSGHVALNNDAGNISFVNTSAYTIGAGSGIVYTLAPSQDVFAGTGISTAPTGSATLTAGGDIGQDSGFNDRIVTGMLNLARLGGANPNVTLVNANNAIDKLGTVALGSGALTLVDANALTLTSAVTAGALTLTAPALTLAGGTVTTTGAQTYHGAMTLGAATALVSTGGGITGDGAINLGVHDLTVNAAGAGLISGAISGSGRFIKAGGGTTTLSGNDTYTGATLVNAGTLLVDGSIAASVVTTVAGGATLGGHGTVGAVHVASGGVLAPGASAGILTTGNLSLAAGAHLAIELGGLNPGLYDQLKVHGSVDLTGATLDAALINGFAPISGEYVLIDNDGADAVIGTFAGLAEGAFLNGSMTLSISYHGGDGNDVVLRTTQPNHAPVNIVPGTQSVAAGMDLSIAGLGVVDQDAGSGILTTTLSVANGTLTVMAAGGAIVAGSGSANVTLAGTLTQINATLGTLIYHAQAGFTGNDTLLVTSSDNGNSGAGGPLTDSDSVQIRVTSPVAQPPQPIVGTDGDDSFTAPAGDSIFIGKSGTDTITFGFRLVDATVTYSGNQIIIDGPNGSSHTVVSGIEVFNFADGAVNTRDGNPLIDDLFYYAHNRDVWTAHIDADTHFNLFGWREGRDPNAWFDTKGYLAQYADVRAAGLNPLAHYDQNGFREGRDPSVAFDTGDYLSHYADVAAAHVDPLAHFLAWGSEEARTPFNDGVWG